MHFIDLVWSMTGLEDEIVAAKSREQLYRLSDRELHAIHNRLGHVFKSGLRAIGVFTLMAAGVFAFVMIVYRDFGTPLFFLTLLMLGNMYGYQRVVGPLRRERQRYHTEIKRLTADPMGPVTSPFRK